MAVIDAAPRLLTADDLLRLYSDGVRGELIRGVLCETMPTGMEHGEIVMRLGRGELLGHIQPRRLGRLMGSDSGSGWSATRTRCGNRTSPTLRPPGFTPDQRVTGYAEVAPDLVVEVASPGDSRQELHDKALMWLSYGVRLVWVVHPATRTVDAHRAGGGVATLTEGDVLDGLDALPGFSCPLRDLFDA